MIMTRSNRPEAGFTLVELMVALAISVIVLAAVLSLFMYQQRAYVQQSELARNQAQLRGALQTMSRDIRMAGYTGIPLGFDRAEKIGLGLYPIAPWPMTGSTTKLPDGTQPRKDSQYGQSEAIEVWGNFTRATATLAANYSFGANIITIYWPVVNNQPQHILVDGNVKRILIGNENSVSYHEITALTDGNTIATITINPPLTVPVYTGDIVAPIIRRIFFVADAAQTSGALTEQVGTLYQRTYMVNPNLALAARYRSGGTGTCFQDEPLADHIDYLNVRYYLSLLDGAGVPTQKIDNSPDAAGSETNAPSNPCRINSIDLRLVSKTFQPLTAQGQRGATPLILDNSQNVKARNVGLAFWSCAANPALSAWTEQECGGT